MSADLKFHERYADESVRFEVRMDADYLVTVRFEGKGTMAGTQAFTQLVDRCRALPGAHGRLKGLVDLSALDGAPLRSQMVLGKWLVGCRDAFHRLAIAGGGRFERGLAKAVTAMARMENVAFTTTVEEAQRFLVAGR